MSCFAFLSKNSFRARAGHIFIIGVGLILTFLPAILTFDSGLQIAVVRGYRHIAYSLAHKPGETLLLTVPFYRQEHSLSCEAASLKMALNYRGIDVSEQELISKIGFETTARYEDLGIWGDPQLAFVGNIDGKMLVDGYGVYNRPIERVANEYRKESFSLEGGTVEDLISNLQSGNPVIIWSYIGNGRKMTWKTHFGEVIQAVHGEHTRVIRGFSGEPSQPKGFFMVDPIYGYIYEPLPTFLKKWDSLGRLAVVMK